MASSPHVIDVTDADFEQQVIERSRTTPVVVDFWAEWCGPCRTLGPIIEDAVERRGGEVVLAKVDVDANQRIAQQYRVQGIPAVKAFKDGQVADEFVGAQPPQVVEAFLDRLVPSEADRLVADARDRDPDTASELLRRALELDPQHRGAALALAGHLVDEDPEEALLLVKPHRPAPEAEAIVTRVQLAAHATGDLDQLRARVDEDPTDAPAQLELGRALAAAGQHREALHHLIEAVRGGGDVREEAREQVVGLLGVIEDQELVSEARRRLASALF